MGLAIAPALFYGRLSDEAIPNEIYSSRVRPSKTAIKTIAIRATDRRQEHGLLLDTRPSMDTARLVHYKMIKLS